MPHSTKLENLEETNFSWGKKIGRIGELQLYESFTYDTVDYTLYDCVYMFAQAEARPHIGKLVKIWEDAGGSKKVKIQWFFRPLEISHYLRDMEVADDELFFATGEGTGLSNTNPLEAIAGKCNVVCVSRDSRNPQPSAEDMQMADYVFYRLFDVKNCLILDKMDDKVGGLDVQFVFNRTESNNIEDISKLASNNKEDDSNAIVNLSDANTPVLKTRQSDGNFDLDGEREKSARKSCSLGTSTLKSSKLDDSCELLEHKDKNCDGISTLPGNDIISVSINVASSVAKTKPGHHNNIIGPGEKEKLAESLNSLDGRASQENVLSFNEVIKSADYLHSVQIEKESEQTNKSGAKGGRPSNFNIVSPRASAFWQGGPSVHDIGHENDSARLGKDAAANPCTFDERPSKKVKFDTSVKSQDKSNTVQKLEKYAGGDAKKLLEAVGSNEDKTKQGQVNGSIGLDKAHSKEACMERSKISKGKVSKSWAVAPASMNSGRVEGQTFEVTQRPVVAKSTWFNELPLEERLRNPDDPGALVLLLNLDPEYTSGEVEDIIWHAFNERCEAKMIQRTAVSSPYCGRAFVIFKKKEAAEKVIRKLDDGCLMLSNSRPLVGCYAAVPGDSGRQTSFAGHLALDDVRRQTQRNARDAVSTSHYSQANTIEYEMAMDWCLFQSRSDIWWKMLYEGQKEQLRKLSANLKSIEYHAESSFVKEK